MENEDRRKRSRENLIAISTATAETQVFLKTKQRYETSWKLMKPVTSSRVAQDQISTLSKISICGIGEFLSV